MGYNSHWEGALTPSKTIPGELVEIINGMDLDVCVVTGTQEDNDSDGDVGDVVPACREMTGANLAEDICRVQKLLNEKKTKITLSGEITRSGASTGDLEQFKVIRGVVYRRPGEIVYGKFIPVTLDRWAVRVTTQFKRWPGTWKTCGWVITEGCPVRTAVAWSRSDTPPLTAARFESENEARIAAHNHTDKTHRCKVVKTEALR